MLKVSCLCPTYNRMPHNLVLVEEAVESFLRQDYPNKELILLNDAAGQTLRFDHPEVRVVNTPFRCASLGEKRNLLADLATGDLLCGLDDDDISLPWRLTKSVEMIGDADYYNPGTFWFLDREGLHHNHALSYAYFTSMCRRSAYQELGGTLPVSVGEDAAMHFKLLTRRVAERPPLSLEERFYIYRWGVSPIHLSSRLEDTLYREVGELPVEKGEFILTPHWEQDYAALTRAYAFALKVA